MGSPAAWLSPSLLLSPSQPCHLSSQCCRRTLRKQLDHNLTFHKLVAYALALLTGSTLLLTPSLLSPVG